MAAINYKCPYCGIDRVLQSNFKLGSKSEIKVCKNCKKEYVIRISVTISTHKIQGEEANEK